MHSHIDSLYLLKITMRKPGYVLLLVIFVVGAGLFVPANPVFAHHLLPKHQLNCSPFFPCPDKLKRRVDFWINTFKEWDSNIAVFHDPNVPERVYATVKTGHGCSRKVSRRIKKERKKIKSALYNVAKKIEAGSTLKDPSQIHYAELFKGKSPNQIRRAAENIRCQSGVQDSFVLGLKRFGRYSGLVDSILAQYDLPPDIRYLPFVESSYNPYAYSSAGAAGMWQIMPDTARTLGLELNATLDERMDPEAATHAAAKYLVNARRTLTKLARSLDSGIREEEIYPFVITSYNYGLNGMQRAIRAIKPDYLAVLENYRSPRFQVAVKNFYASFLAARHVSLHADKYFAQVKGYKKLRYATYVLTHPTSIDRIESVFKVEESQLKRLNPGLTRFVWHRWRMVPPGYQLKLPYRNGGYQREIERLRALAPETEVPGSGKYIVRRGDTACGIARGLKVNCRELIRVNQLGKRALIRIGQELVIPTKWTQANQTAARVQDQPGGGVYSVKRGDTACGIAQRYGVSCRSLIRLNRLNRKATIYVGQNLTIPGGGRGVGQLPGLDENNRYLVRKGDFACAIAKRFSVNCRALVKLNRLDKKARIYPGQKLKIPGLEVPDSAETVEQLAQVETTVQNLGTGSSEVRTDQGALANLLDSLPELKVFVSGPRDNPVYRIKVEPDETLGHYSDWLGLRSTQVIRKLNRFQYKTVLRIGQTLKLPVTSAEMVSQFEQKRMEYHQVLSESLKEHYVLTGIEKYKIRPGDTVWSLSTESGFPVWIFYRINPSLNIYGLRVGQEVLLPKLQRKQV